MESKYANELIQLEADDLAVRDKLLQENNLNSGYHPEMEKIHKSNAKRLREIISEIGFPTISKVGKQASDSAWLIVQHAIAEPDFMKHSYAMMLENIDDINPKNLAYLFDRIQFFQGKPQKYGTQLNEDGTIYPVIDKYGLNEERKKHNLKQLSRTEIEQILSPESIDQLESQNVDYVAWRKEVGWK